MPRFYCPTALGEGAAIELPPSAARHVQVLRLQPGAPITLFNGQGGEWAATVTRMGRSEVVVQVGAHQPVEREAQRPVHLLVASIANERMDWLVEKAAELGAASLSPILAQRSVLKLVGERADKKQAHWQGIASAACEQCGRNRVPPVHPALSLAQWLEANPVSAGGGMRAVLSLHPLARPLNLTLNGGLVDNSPLTLLSGPEGGLTPTEEAQALAAGFIPVTLGNRVLRAETAPLAALAVLGCR